MARIVFCRLLNLPASLACLAMFIHGLPPQLAYGVEVPPEKSNSALEVLTMESALSKASRNNPTLVGARLTLELAELTFENARDAMFLPSVKLVSGAASRYTVAQVPNSPVKTSNTFGWGGDTSISARERGAPDPSTVALNVGEYTLYNFGKDRDAYESAAMGIDRARQKIRETERQVRLDVINKVYKLKTQQDLLDVSNRSVEHTEAVFELIKSRIPLGKAAPSDLSSAEIDLLNARNERIRAQTSFSQALWDVNQVLGDMVGRRYDVQVKITFEKFKKRLSELIAIYKENAPQIKDARLTLEQARIANRIEHKNALPLPTITFSGVSVGYNFLNTQTTPTRTSTATQGGGGNMNVSVGLSLSMPLVGSGGFLNHRALRSSQIAVEQAELGMRTAGNSTEVELRNAFTQLQQQEESIGNNEKLFKEAAVVLEAALQKLQGKEPLNRLDLKNSIEQIRRAEQELTSAIQTHYTLKLQIANLIGVDGFDGETPL